MSSSVEEIKYVVEELHFRCEKIGRVINKPDLDENINEKHQQN